MIKKSIYFCFFILFAFIIINFLLVLIWPKITNYNINKGKFYPDKVLELIEIQPNERSQFFREMLIDRKFQYQKFIGHYEQDTNNQKYLNVNLDNGRKIENNINCERSFFFFGSSNTFGYNVKDNQTIPANFKKILLEKNKNKNYCVYNFGSAYYYSTQETVFFITKILNDKIKKNDFIFFIDGISENGNQENKVDEKIKELFTFSNYKIWEKIYFTAPLFFESLPVVQLYERIFREKIRKTKLKEKDLIIDDDEIFNVFQKNVIIRKSICEGFQINCYTFLQPFPYISGNFEKNILVRGSTNKEIEFKKKYQLLKVANNIFDITSALDNMQELSYVDAGHYSPKASAVIAETIYMKILRDLN